MTYANPVDDPRFYCHGRECIVNGCTPLFCIDEAPPAERANCPGCGAPSKQGPPPTESDDE